MRNYVSLFIRDAQEIESRDQLLRYFITSLERFGLDRLFRKHDTWEFRATAPSKGDLAVNIRPEAPARYYGGNHHLDDPLIAAARCGGGSFRIRDMMGQVGRSPRQAEFREIIIAGGFENGVVIPVYSRPGDFAFFALASSAHVSTPSDADLMALQTLCTAFHASANRLACSAALPQLSRRETEVLELIARGRTNTGIASALHLSGNTVDTLVRRSFVKLGVSSRVEAALVAMSRGLIIP